MCHKLSSSARARKTQLEVAAAVLGLAKTDDETENSRSYVEDMKKSHFSLTNLAFGRGAK